MDMMFKMLFTLDGLQKSQKKKEIGFLEVVDENPTLTFQEITNFADVGFGHSMILCHSSFCFKIPKKKSFWRFG